MRPGRRLTTSLWLATLAITVGIVACSGDSGKKSGKSGANITIGFFPDEENFGVIRYSQASAARPITLQNLGKTNYFISSLTLSDESEFRIESHNCPGSTKPLTPSQGCEIDLVFKPKDFGDRKAQIIARFGSAVGDAGQEARADLIGVGGSSLLFPGIDTVTNIGGTTMTLNWTHVVGAQQYIVYRIEGDKSTEFARVQAPTKTYRINGLSLDTAYTWRVRLLDSYGYPDDNVRDRTARTLNLLPPRIDSISQTGGPIAGGTTLTLSGANFLPGLSVKIGSVVCANANYVSASSATCVTNMGVAGTYPVVLENNDGQQAIYESFTYQNAPVVSSVVPAYGTWQGGTSVTINGVGFVSGASVSIGGYPCQSVAVLSANVINCYTAPLPQAIGGLPSDVVVTNTDTQSGTLTQGFNYQFMDLSVAAGTIYPFGCQGGSAAVARFRTPRALYYDGSDLYISGYDDYAIWKVDVTTGNVVRFAGKPCISGAFNGPAADATISNPFGIVKIGADVYFAQYGNHTIRKIDGTTGEISILAGAAGSAGSTNATGGAARFNNPRGLATDGTYIYVADMSNDRIRRIDPATGVVTTLAGSTAGMVNDTGTAARFNSPRDLVYHAGALYVGDYSNHRIRKIDVATAVVTTFSGQGTAGHVDGAAATARFNQISGLTTDGTDLFVAERLNVIRRVSLADGSVSVLAGLYNTAEVLDAPIGIDARFRTPEAIGCDGTYVYVADASETIRRVHIASGAVSTFLGAYQTPYYGVYQDGANARFSTPYGIAVNGTNAYVADSGNHRIRHIDLTTNVTSLIAGAGAGGADGVGAAATFNSPRDIVYCNSMLYVADYAGQIIRSVDPATGTTTTIAGTYNTAGYVDAIGSAARFNGPIGLAADSACTTLYVADYSNHRIRRINLTTLAVDTVAGSGVAGTVDGVGPLAQLTSPYRLQIIGSYMYLTSGGDHKLRRITLSNFAVLSLNSGTAGFLNASDASSARFYNPRAMTSDGERLYIADYTNHAVRVYHPSNGAVTTIVGGQAPASYSNNSMYPYGEVLGDIATEARIGFPFGAGYSATEGLLITTPYGVLRMR